MFRKAIRAYDRCLNARPILTKCTSSWVIMTCADLLRQRMEARGKGSEGDGHWWDRERSLRMSAWGATVHPLAVHFWFNNLERWLGPNPIGASKFRILGLAGRKVVVDQLLSSPVFLGSFLVYCQLSQGKSLEEAIKYFKNEWLTLMKGGWSCWPLAHIFNFAFVPIHWRALYVNFVQLGFGMFLSMMGNEGSDGISTPVDSLYQRFTGSQETFGNVEMAAAVIGASWVLGASNMAYHWRRVGLNGLGCTLVGGTVAFLEISVINGENVSWRDADDIFPSGTTPTIQQKSCGDAQEDQTVENLQQSPSSSCEIPRQ